MKTLMYADDTTFISQDKDIERCADLMQQELVKACQWFVDNKLSLNESKTKFQVFRKNNIDAPIILKLGNKNIERKQATSFNLLGVEIDESLSWSSHLKKVIGKMCTIAPEEGPITYKPCDSNGDRQIEMSYWQRAVKIKYLQIQRSDRDRLNATGQESNSWQRTCSDQ